MSTDQAAIDRLAERALDRYGLEPDSTVRLLNVSENWTYRIDEPAAGRTFALRVHRPGYHRRGDRVRARLDRRAARQWRGGDGPCRCLRRRQPGDSAHDDQAFGERNVVLFEWLSGEMPELEGKDLLQGFRTLGAVSAGMHGHAREWRRPPTFQRFSWDYDTTLGASGHWGRWQDGLGMGSEELELLGRLDAVIRRRLEAYGSGPERFGLVHADIRLANLLVDGPHVRVIDFDDCGFYRSPSRPSLPPRGWRARWWPRPAA